MSSAEWNLFDVRLDSTHAVSILAAFHDCARDAGDEGRGSKRTGAKFLLEGSVSSVSK